MKQIAALFASWCIISAVFIGCTSSNSGSAVGITRDDNNASYAGPKTKGDWIFYHIPNEPGSLNPYTETSSVASEILSYVQEAMLTRNAETQELEPVIADSLPEISDDHLTYTFHIRKDVHYSDGVPVTAHDFKFCYDVVMCPYVDCASTRNYYTRVESVEVPDDYTIIFHCKEPYVHHDVFLGGNLIALPRHIYDPDHLLEKNAEAFGEYFNNHPNNRNPIGSGPYKFVEWKTSDQIVLERDPNYWRNSRPNSGYLDRLIFKIITDDPPTLTALKKGELDLSTLTPIQFVTQTNSAKFLKEYVKDSYYAFAYSYIGWNCKKPFFQDKRVRQAMTHLINRKQILETLMYGRGVIAVSNFYFKSKFFNHDIKPWPYDPEEAVRLLDEAGWKDTNGDGIRDKDGIDFRFEFLTTQGGALGPQVATIIKEDLSKVGIDMSIRFLEWSVFLENVEDQRFDATWLGWGLGTAEDPYQIWHSSSALNRGSNHVSFINAEVDSICEAGRTEFDVEKRKKMFLRLQEILHDEQPYTFMFTNLTGIAYDKRFKGVYWRPFRPAIPLEEFFVPTAEQKYTNPNM
jgi:peptide/nickel transport system substrate-binding protein